MAHGPQRGFAVELLLYDTRRIEKPWLSHVLRFPLCCGVCQVRTLVVSMRHLVISRCAVKYLHFGQVNCLGLRA